MNACYLLKLLYTDTNVTQKQTDVDEDADAHTGTYEQGSERGRLLFARTRPRFVQSALATQPAHVPED